MTLGEKTAPFHEILSEPFVVAKEWKNATGGRIIGHLLPDVPEELIHASGALPLPLLPRSRRATLPPAQLPGFICALVSDPMSDALNGRLDFMDGAVIPYVCDSTRALSHVWELHFGNRFSHSLWLPKKMHEGTPMEFLYEELARMRRAVGRFLGKEIAKAAINLSIEIYNRNRGLLRRLHHIKKRGLSSLTNADYFACVESSMLIPKDDHSRLLMDLLKALEVDSWEDFDEKPEKPRIFLFGAVCDPDLARCIDEVGLEIVDDNLYNGTRVFSSDVPPGDDPIRSLTERQFSKDPLSCYQYPEGKVVASLSRRWRDANIDGVLFLSPRYCEPLEFDYPAIKSLAAQLSVPLLFLETDLTSRSLAQLRTRIQAFSEILTDRKDGNI